MSDMLPPAKVAAAIDEDFRSRNFNGVSRCRQRVEGNRRVSFTTVNCSHFCRWQQEP